VQRRARAGAAQWIDELIAKKVGGTEQQTLSDEDVALHHREYLRLRDQLVREQERSTLPERVTTEPAMRDLLRRIRLARPDQEG